MKTLEAQELSVSRNGKTLLRDVSFTLRAGEWLADYPPDGCVQVDCHDFPVDETDGDYMAYDFTITGTAPGRECISLDLVRDGKTVYFIEIEVLVEEDLGVHLKDTAVYSWRDLGRDEE